MSKTQKVCFVHGRPGPHPFHHALAESVNAEFRFVDPILGWHGQDRSKAFRYLSMLVCGLSFPKARSFDVILSESAHAAPLIAGRTTLGRRRPTTAALMDDETFYFMSSKFYPPSTVRLMSKLIRSFDALICVGTFQLELAREIVGNNSGGPALLRVSSSISDERIAELSAIRPNLESPNIVFIGNGPSGWRSWYKGIDILLDSFELAARALPDLSLTIVGDWDDTFQSEAMSGRPAIMDRVFFAGKVDNIGRVLADAALYLHLARGEAFGISILEAMAAGVPAIVSNLTGAKEAVEQVDSDLVVPAEAEAASRKIVEYFQLSAVERESLSRRSRSVASEYTFERARTEFADAIGTVAKL